MSQYTEVRKRLAEQRRQAQKLPPRKPPPEDFKAAMERIKAELAARAETEGWVPFTPSVTFTTGGVPQSQSGKCRLVGDRVVVSCTVELKRREQG